MKVVISNQTKVVIRRTRQTSLATKPNLTSVETGFGVTQCGVMYINLTNLHIGTFRCVILVGERHVHAETKRLGFVVDPHLRHELVC